MTSIVAKLRASLARLRKSEAGAASVEFAIVFPFFVGVFVSGFEVAMMNARAVMLERATDVVVRNIRLSSGATLNYDTVLADICNTAGIIPDCMNTTRIELQAVNTTTWAGLDPQVDCIRRDLPIQPLVKFENGQQNEMMLIRICAVVDPFFPTIGVGRSMPKDETGGYQIVASSAFVNEPQ